MITLAECSGTVNSVRYRYPRLIVLLTFLLLGACGEQTVPEASNSPLTMTHSSMVERGQYLSIAANCVGCHTPLGKTPFSGGRAIPTPFGDVISSNLTADPETGLGKWSNDDFWQALHNGKSREGRSLYPAFPYPSYSLITRDDSDAIFTYLKTIPAVNHTTPPHRLRFPYSRQWALDIWRALYFEPAAFESDSSRSERWNRGAYFVEGLGHCGTCHTPRGTLGGYDEEHHLQGTHIEGLGWDAPSLAQGPLTEQQQAQMLRLLKSGINEREVMSGPMAEVVGSSLQYIESDDLAAMVEYLASLPDEGVVADKKPPLNTNTLELGLKIYEEQCLDCHGAEGQGEAYRYPALAGNRSVNTVSPRNAINSVLFGGFGASTTDRPRPYGMPAFAQKLNDKEVAAVLSYIRSAWGNTASAVRASLIWR